MRASPIRVLLVDDHALFREGLAGLLSSQHDIEVISEAEDGLEALVKAQDLEPDLILMDVTMPGCDGMEATQLIKQVLPEVKIVMLTVHDDDDRLFEAIRSGAVGYLLKSLASEEVIPMLRRVMRGEAGITGTTAVRILDEFRQLDRRTKPRLPEESAPRLTPREKDVLKAVATGAMDREIAAELSISITTVKTHMRNILAKLHATGRREAVAYAVGEGLIHPPDSGSAP